MSSTAPRRPLHNPELGPAGEEGKPSRTAGTRPAWLPSYIPELDGLRGLAVLAVVIYHTHLLLKGTWIYPATLWGWAGVNLFFVLSGFLITSILLESRGKPHYFRNFYARRALRIWPVYFLLIAVCYFQAEWFLGDTWEHQTHWQILTSYLFFIQNLRHTPLPGTLGPTWSLAIEEQYYFVWAPLVWLSWHLSRWRLRSRIVRNGCEQAPNWPAQNGPLAVVLIAMFAASPIFRLSHAHFLNTTHTLIHLDGIALGSLIALALHSLAIARRTWLWIGLASAIFGFWSVATIFAGTAFLDTGLALGFCGVVLMAIAGTGSAILAWLRRGPLAFYGKISYGLYMTHILVFVFYGSFNVKFDHMGLTGSLIIVALRLIASTVVATVLWYAVESQILKLKRYF